MSAARVALGSALAVAVLALALWWVLAFLLQRTVLFPPGRSPPRDVDLARLGGERVWLDADGSRAEAWLLPARAGAPRRPLLLFAHGNGELIDDWRDAFEPARERGASVLLVEYPGYGRSGGAPSESSIRAAMRAAWDHAASQERVDRARIVGWGRSLGGGAVCALAEERPLAALVLESTFTSVRDMARRFLVPGFLVRDPFDNLSLVRRFEGPLLLLHGERDEVVAVDHARALAAAAPRAELHLLPCGHNDCPRPWSQVLGFLAVHGLL